MLELIHFEFASQRDPWTEPTFSDRSSIFPFDFSKDPGAYSEVLEQTLCTN